MRRAWASISTPSRERARQVGAVDAGRVTQRRVEARLLDDLADQGVARVLAVVEAAARAGSRARCGMIRGARRLRRISDGRDRPRSSQDDGVRRHPLSPRQGSHGTNL